MTSNEVAASTWDDFYSRGDIPWRTYGLSDVTRSFLGRYAGRKGRLLEVGCGTAAEGAEIQSLGFEYSGVDISEIAINEALNNFPEGFFRSEDFMMSERWCNYDVVYDKGVFHGLAGIERRMLFAVQVARALVEKGIWITVCGSADQRVKGFSHGAVYLTDLIEPVEKYFEVLEVIKAPYGITESRNDFNAWHAVFMRRS